MLTRTFRRPPRAAARTPGQREGDAAYNHQATLSFASASTQNMSSGSWASPLALPETVYVVGNYDGTATDQRMTDDTASFDRVTGNGVSVVTGFGTTSNGATLDIATATTASPNIYAGYFDTAANSKIWVSTLTAAATGNAGTSAATRTGIVVGSSAGNAAFTNGKIAEVFVVAGAVSAATHALAMAYLGTRYGISVGG